MVICATGGKLGTGKTASLVYFALLGKYKHGDRIYSNFNIKFGDEQVRTIGELDKIRGGRVYLDELWLWCWARKSMDNLNETVIKIITDFRKRNVDLYFTQHIATSTDLFIRDLVDEWYIPELHNPIGLLDDGFKTRFGKGTITMETTGKRYWFNMHFIGALFDTNEEIEDLQKGVTGYLEIVEELVEDPYFKILQKLSAKRQYIRNKYRVSRDEADLIDDLLKVNASVLS